MLKDLFKTIPVDILLELQNLDLNIPSENCNREINALLQRTVLIGGKRLRPLLTYLMANLFGLKAKEVRTYAKAIEMVHAASLSHDDVVDNATTRRGLPTINQVASNKRAVLAGDYLLADVIVELCKAKNLTLVTEMSKVIQDLAEGEWLQLDASESRHYSREIIEQIALKKTSSVMSWCSVAPAHAAGLSPQLVQYCLEFGKNLGIAFQFMDDTLDFSGESLKDKSLDMQNGIINAVVFEWLSLNPEYMQKFKKGEDILALWDQKNLDDAIAIVKERALTHINKCRELLAIIAKELPSESKDSREKELRPLNMILDYLGQRDF